MLASTPGYSSQRFLNLFSRKMQLRLFSFLHFDDNDEAYSTNSSLDVTEATLTSVDVLDVIFRPLRLLMQSYVGEWNLSFCLPNLSRSSLRCSEKRLCAICSRYTPRSS